jgi:Predicted oxidoreductases of the aldo/keto reductase family
MIYKSFKNLNISMLGMGNMRLPTVGERAPIDEPKAREIIEHAYAAGINYFDTAYMYHNGESESFVGKVLGQYPRETWHIVSKMPGHSMKYENGKLDFIGLMSGQPSVTVPEIFETQLKRCNVDYFDFYMLHNVCETAYELYTNEELGIVKYLLEQKKAGRIRHLGFSAHGRADTINRFLNHYKNCFEFVQIQLNYLDWTLQDAKSKYEVITKHGLPVIVMEPVRGGSLASLNCTATAMLKSQRPYDTIVSWAFRYLQSLPNVLTVLSGMSDMKQLTDNIQTFAKPDPTTEAENMLLDKVVHTMASLVPCTSCRYCCDGCPQRLDIPKLISMYNEKNNGARDLIMAFTLNAMKEDELPTACIDCGACTQLCPQNIDIPEIMRKFDTLLSSPK